MGGSSCAAYLQLFSGWLLINFVTFLMATIPDSAEFLDIKPDLYWESGHVQSNSEPSDPPQFSWMDSHSMVLGNRYIVYGLWVLVEIALFFVLLVTATIIMCGCKKVPPGPGFIHLMVDPAIITLVSVPFVLIRGLPRAAALQSCFIHFPSTVSYYTVANNNLTNKTISKRIGAGVECLLALPYKLPANLTLLDSNSYLSHHTETVIRNKLQGWITLLQCAVISPAIIRFVHFRWKMSWQPFIHSNTYFFIQSLDGATLIQLSTSIYDSYWNLTCQTLTYMASLGLCIGSLTLAIPPIYVGNQVTNKYLKWSTYIGTILIDVPFLTLRIYSLLYDGKTVKLDIDGIFCAMLIKEMTCVIGFLCFLCKKISQCVGSKYLSLYTNDPDCEEYEMNGIGDYS